MIENGLIPRVLCECGADEAGPSVAVVTGLHGNEPDAGEALREFDGWLRQFGGLKRGRVAVFSGNRRGLAVRQRYLDRDMNRGWTEGRLARLAEGVESQDPREDYEQIELFRAVEAFLGTAEGMRVVLDLHSFSGAGRPFILGTDRSWHRTMARALGLTMVFGLQEALAGALSDFYDSRADVSLAIEAGRTSEPLIQERIRDFLRRMLVQFEMCAGNGVEELPPAEPGILRVTYRHPVAREDAFRMLPGFASFREVGRGEILAQDVQGPIQAPHDGWLLMPLYQEVGNDGFFLAQRDETP